MKEKEEVVEVRDLQKEIDDLEKSENIKILGIETIDGIVSRPVVETAIDSLKDTLKQIDLDGIAKSVNKDLKDFSKRV